jgi:ABC-type glutathione transport system ATPase component
MYRTCGANLFVSPTLLALCRIKRDCLKPHILTHTTTFASLSVSPESTTKPVAYLRISGSLFNTHTAAIRIIMPAPNATVIDISDAPLKASSAPPVAISFTDVTITVPLMNGEGTKDLVSSVSGVFGPSELIAVMGPSGSGKTSK